MTRLMQVHADGLVLDVTDTGPLDGEPVVLLHGFPQRATSWGAVSAHLHAAGLRTYALDQRGYSPGARPRSRFAYGVEALRGDVLALVDAIGGPVHLVGHDWGAAVAWDVAGHAPERVRSLVAVSVPHPAAFLRSMTRSGQALRSWYMLAFQVPLLPEWLLTHHPERFLKKFRMTDEMVAAFRREIVADGALRGGLGWYRSLPTLRPGSVSGRVTVPTTYVWSDDDAALGRKGAELTERYVRGPYRFEVMTGVSHWIPEERPAELAALVVDRVGRV
jgi:pimeloyl-ACP methyl ester carboxylesterase